MVKNIIFDMGNVLLDYNPDVSLDMYCTSKEERDIIKKELFEGPEWVQGDLGYMSESERYDIVKERVDEKYWDTLKKCANDGILVSADVHMIKPDIKIYECFINKFMVKPDECLFIDDRLANIEGATKVGINGVVFKNDFENIKIQYNL